MQKRMLRLGWPAALNRTERTLTQVMFGFLVAPFGDVAYAAFTVTRRLEGFGHMGVGGIGNAAGTMAGQTLGRLGSTAPRRACCGRQYLG